jgi:hypothetical protein
MNNPIQTEHLLQFMRECKDMSLKTDARINIPVPNSESVKVINDENSLQGITLTFSNFKIDFNFSSTQ